jgi:hypothetical protein
MYMYIYIYTYIHTYICIYYHVRHAFLASGGIRAAFRRHGKLTDYILLFVIGVSPRVDAIVLAAFARRALVEDRLETGNEWRRLVIELSLFDQYSDLFRSTFEKTCLEVIFANSAAWSKPLVLADFGTVVWKMLRSAPLAHICTGSVLVPRRSPQIQIRTLCGA